VLMHQTEVSDGVEKA